MNKHIFNNQHEVARALADEMVRETNANETLYVSLSGGSTPKLLFDLLAAEYLDKADWHKVHFFWGDERLVPPDHEDSNYAMTKSRFFDKADIKKEYIHRVYGEKSPEEAKSAYAQAISSVVPQKDGFPRFDICILGMGEDGHTASIFPDNLKLMDSQDTTAIVSHPKTGQKRITLTGKVINNSRRSIFLVTGKSKAERIREIAHGTGAVYPAAYIKSANGPAEWFLDKEAARLIG